MVFGAHLSGEPLNPQLQVLGARFVRACRTSADYRLYALKGGVARPGLVRVDSGGAAIEGDIWALPPAAFGVFVAEIPTPPAIAAVRRSEERRVGNAVFSECSTGVAAY